MYGTSFLVPPEDPPVPSVLEALLLGPDCVVVEFGCGRGHFTLPIAARLQQPNPRGLIFAFDLSEGMIGRLEEDASELGLQDRIRPWPLMRLGDPNKLPIGDGKVDRVLAVNSVQYLDDPLPICREFARVLKPGGLALLADWNRPIEKVGQGAGVSGPSIEKTLAALTDAGLAASTRLDLEGYTWVVRAGLSKSGS